MTRTYSENTENDYINDTLLNAFLENYRSVCSGGSISSIGNSSGIIGIFVHSVKISIETRNIRADIKKKIRAKKCVMCDCTVDIVCDHKNDLYNDRRVLILEEQLEEDFQPLCQHCNLLKRQICKEASPKKIELKALGKASGATQTVYTVPLAIICLRQKTYAVATTK